MDVLLIHPEYIDQESPGRTPGGLLSIGTVLKQAGHCVKLLNLQEENVSYTDVERDLDRRHYDLIGVGGIVTAYRCIKNVVNLAKTAVPHVPVVVGGGLATALPEFVLEHMPADVIVRGEGEVTILELVRAIEVGNDWSDVEGLHFRRDNCIVATPDRSPIMNLDILPFPDYSLIDADMYFEKQDAWLWGGRHRSAAVVTSRSCPFHCKFCYHPLGQIVRKRSNENVIAEIEWLVETYGVDGIFFQDELFTLSKEKMTQLCNILMRRNTPVKWFASSRVDTVDYEMLANMRRAGCVGIILGVESASLTSLKSMDKRITPWQIAEAIRTARSAGIEPHTSWIIGVPGETRESVEETVKFIKKHNIYCDAVRFVTPYPRCFYYDELMAKGAIDDLEAFLLSLERSPLIFLSYNLTNMPDSELVRLKEEMEWEVRSHYCQSNPLTVKEVMATSGDQLKAKAICTLQACGSSFEVSWEKGHPPFLARCPDCHKNYYVSTRTLEQNGVISLSQTTK